MEESTPQQHVRKNAPYRNWKHHTGVVDLSYETNTKNRQRKKCNRRHGLVKRAHQLSTICGGTIFLRYEDEKGNIYTYTNSDTLWINYSKEGFKRNLNEERLDRNGSVIKLEKFDFKIKINSAVEQNKTLNENVILTTVTPVEKVSQDASALGLRIVNPHHNAIVDQAIPVNVPEAGEVIIETDSSVNTVTDMQEEVQNKPSINSVPKQKPQLNLKRLKKHNKLKPAGTLIKHLKNKGSKVTWIKVNKQETKVTRIKA
jgi:hypothetical protein